MKTEIEIDEKVLKIYKILENEFKFPRDSFYDAENFSDEKYPGKLAWKIKLKSDEKYFIWIFDIGSEVLFDCYPRTKAITWGDGGISLKNFNSEIRRFLEFWSGETKIRLKFEGLLYHDKKYSISSEEEISLFDKLIYQKELQRLGFNPYKDFITFEAREFQKFNNKPWLFFQRVGTNFYFQIQLVHDNIPFKYKPGNYQLEVREGILQINQHKLIEGSNVFQPCLVTLGDWIKEIKNKSLKDSEYYSYRESLMDSIDNPGTFSPCENDFVDADFVEDEPPLTNQERKEFREFLKYWRESAEQEPENSEEQIKKLDKEIVKAEFEVAHDKTFSKSKANGFIRNIWKVAKEEAIKYGVRMLFEKAVV